MGILNSANELKRSLIEMRRVKSGPFLEMTIQAIPVNDHYCLISLSGFSFFKIFNLIAGGKLRDGY